MFRFWEFIDNHHFIIVLLETIFSTQITIWISSTTFDYKIRSKLHAVGQFWQPLYIYIYFFLILVGYPPFSESHDSAPLNEQILKGLYTFPDEFWSEISAPAKDLIRQMMCVDPIKRLTITSVLEHPWLANDHDNTVRVDKIMYPTLQTMKSMKRAARDEEAAMDQGDETSSADIYPSSGKNNKRIKY
ncbi:unnamed protein product [Rotaria magnacalcarata]|uniref:Protein kinase domain-containing protein n=1 Tax=Rotaria magnacalcarata TaxID=392030 RepID=A0A819TEY6_9BILA|nr:unnamed protein product [Rotaria magnacalcarata]CAF4064591.1 unnamed protein product [Rotaria magnacalcarata]